MKYPAKQVYDALATIADDVRDDYSGRSMYGKTCPGFVVEAECEAFEVFVDLAEEDPEMARYLARNAHIDSMGHGMIIYWPRITFEEKESA